jgi:mRNA interferase HigB
LTVISRRAIREFAVGARLAALEPLLYWHDVAKGASWRNPAEVRRDFNTVDFVGECVVFDIGGNKYRLIAKIKYRWGIGYVRRILTHREYDKGGWQNEC